MLFASTIADTLRDLGTVAAALAAIVTLSALVARLRPVRWVFKTLVGQPVQSFFRAEVKEVVEEALRPVRHELEFDHGHSLKDAVWTIARHTGAPVPPKPNEGLREGG